MMSPLVRQNWVINQLSYFGPRPGLAKQGQDVFLLSFSTLKCTMFKRSILIFAGHRKPTVSHIILEDTVMVPTTGCNSELTLEGAIHNDPCSPLVQGLSVVWTATELHLLRPVYLSISLNSWFTISS